MGAKRSIEIHLKELGNGNRRAAEGMILDAGIEIAEARNRIIQVRHTTPTEIRRVLKGFKIQKILEGFRNI